MDSLAGVLALGFLLGIEHAVEPDHIVAVTTLVTRTRRLSASFLSGIFWGIGHTITLLLAGLAILLFKLSLPSQVSQSLEVGVGLMLVFLGVWVLRELQGPLHLHRHPHGHDGHSHLHLHEREEGHAHHHGRRALLIGMVHGLAGSAALMLLILVTIKSLLGGLLYILVFGLGSILGMMVFSGAIGLPIVLTAGRLARFNQGLRVVAGMISIGLGLFIIVTVGWGQLLSKL